MVQGEFSMDIAALGDARIFCPQNPDRICPARVNLVELYSVVCDAPGIPPDFNALTDRIKLTTKLAEHSAQTAMYGCLGPENDTCPIRENMDNNRSRQVAVKLIRRIIHRNENN